MDILAVRFGNILRACGLAHCGSFDEALSALEGHLGKLPGATREERLHAAEAIIARKGVRKVAKPKEKAKSKSRKSRK